MKFTTVSLVRNMLYTELDGGIGDVMKIEILEIKDNEDGSCLVTFEIDEETLKFFASQGILQALKAAAEEIVDEK